MNQINHNIFWGRGWRSYSFTVHTHDYSDVWYACHCVDCRCIALTFKYETLKMFVFFLYTNNMKSNEIVLHSFEVERDVSNNRGLQQIFDRRDQETFRWDV